jgi:hypothetical protein
MNDCGFTSTEKHNVWAVGGCDEWPPVHKAKWRTES